jgi:hypothetical protein
MARPDLHKFEKSLKNKPGLGSTDEPRTIKAKNLDDNNKKLTLLKSEETPPAYKVKYTADGTIITDIQGLPKDAIAKEFDICENGSATTYYFVVWNEKPELPAAAE